MRELAKKFINETCVVYSFEGDAKKGVIKEVSEGAILLQKGEKQQVLNLDFISRIKVVPKKG